MASVLERTSIFPFRRHHVGDETLDEEVTVGLREMDNFSCPQHNFVELKRQVRHLKKFLQWENMQCASPSIERLEIKLFPWIAKLSKPGGLFRNLMRAFSGIGLAITVGNAQAATAFLAARALRMLGCQLPIEILYFGDSDLNPKNRVPFEKISDVLFTDASIMLNASMLRDVKGWDLKPFLVLASRFEKTIVMDSDVLFFQKPEVLFTFPLFMQTGVLLFGDRFWPDGCDAVWLSSFLPATELSAKIHRTNYFKGKSRHLVEAGVLVFDKTNPEVLLGLLTVCYLSMSGIRQHVRSYGDKELFWIAYEIANVSYSIDFSVGCIGKIEGSRLCGNILHFDNHQFPLWVQTSKEPDDNWREYTYFAAEPDDHGTSWTGCLDLHSVIVKQLHEHMKSVHAAVMNDIVLGRKLFSERSQ